MPTLSRVLFGLQRRPQPVAAAPAAPSLGSAEALGAAKLGSCGRATDATRWAAGGAAARWRPPAMAWPDRSR